MREVLDKVYDEIEAEYEIRNLKKAGYVRIQNCFWFEHWVKGDTKVILERDFH